MVAMAQQLLHLRFPSKPELSSQITIAALSQLRFPTVSPSSSSGSQDGFLALIGLPQVFAPLWEKEIMPGGYPHLMWYTLLGLNGADAQSGQTCRTWFFL
jgi:hypothetical protein